MNRNNHLSYRQHPHSTLESQESWELAARQLLDEGQAFLACDLARTGIERFPASRSLLQSLALGLTRVGAHEEARLLLEPLVPKQEHTQEQLQEVCLALQAVLPLLTQAVTPEAGSPAIEKLDEFVSSLERIVQPPTKRAPADDEMVGTLARIYKDQWQRTGDVNLALRSRDLYHLHYQATGEYCAGINAAVMSLVIGGKATVQTLARAVLEQCRRVQGAKRADYWLLVTMGEALLLLNEQGQATRKYQEAAELALSRYAWTVSSLQQARLLQQYGVAVPTAVFEALKAPAIVVFVGHMIDAIDRPVPRFPEHLELSVRAAIDRSLDELDARIGYCSAACGSDIVFIEAMLARGAEVNIILPFAEDDFIKESVAFAGQKWLIRYQNALRQAQSISFMTEEPFLNDTILFDYAARIFHGYADLRASTLFTEPHLLAVWDGSATGQVGGTSAFVAHWPDPHHRSVIRLDHLLEAASNAGAASKLPDRKKNVAQKSPKVIGRRCIKTMLFADIVGYSRLDEARIPSFLLEFWSKVAQRLTPKPAFVNTWGDAIFAVMDSCMPLMEFALSFQAAVKEIAWADSGLPEGLDVRIGLHVGPIFEAVDPMTGRTNYYGSHVNRAARLEPVTAPGHIYATESFVALLMSEMSTIRVAASERNEQVDFPFAWEYVGILSLAKNFGQQAAYHIRCIR
jgi:class 3 adenylate cyclase